MLRRPEFQDSAQRMDRKAPLIESARKVYFPAANLSLSQIKSGHIDDADRCAYRKANPGILVVQSAKDRAADNIPGPLGAARDRGILAQ
jgi:hypothetical protein